MTQRGIQEMKEIIYEIFETFCLEKNEQKIIEFLDSFNQCFDFANYEDGKFLCIVANYGNLKLVKLFIEKYSADVHCCDNHILYTAAYHEYYDILHYLLFELKIDVELIHNCVGYETAINYIKIKK